MKSTKRLLLLLCAILTLGISSIQAQSLRGKVIYVHPSQVVKLKFRSMVDNYSFVNKPESNLFNIKLANSRNFSINSLVPNFRPMNLVITEGENTHLFILAYKDKLDGPTETFYDFSSKEKLENEVHKLSIRVKENTKKDAPVKNVPAQKTTDVTEETTTTADAKFAVNQPANSAASSSKQLTKNEIDLKYYDLVELADKAYINNAYDEAKGLYTAALIIKPNDKWCISQLKEVQRLKNSKGKNSKEVPVMADKVNTKSSENSYASQTSNPAKEPDNKVVPDNKTVRDNKTIPDNKKMEIPPAAINGANPESDIDKQYHLTISQGKDALTSGHYDAAKGFFMHAKELKPMETFPSEQLVIIDGRLAAARDSIKYELLIHLGDSTAWIAKNYKDALKWYDSALSIKPENGYPKKQIKAVNYLQAEIDEELAKQARRARYNNAMQLYKKADVLKVERRWDEAYEEYSKFLKELDTTNLAELKSSALYYIEQAKDYLSRLENHITKPIPENITPPIVVEENKSGKKNKKRKRNN